MTPEIVRVEVKPTTYPGMRNGEMVELNGFSVDPIWSGVDRPKTGGYIVKDGRMAARLESAMLAGVVFSDVEVRRDVNGKTFVGKRSHVLGRTMNADLRRLGF